MDAQQAARDRKAKEIFDRAVELPASAARAAYIESACGGDELLCDRVLELLGSDLNDSFLREPIAELLPKTVVIPVTEQPGDTIGRYKLREKIGEGGCGMVYVAEQEQPFRRRVALKLIKVGMDTKQVIARFDAERQALAMMDHPNIAKVLDAGATETGRPYFVMELVRGIKITDYCDQAKLSTRERLELFIKVCQAVQHAHQKGIIHRDLKPSNILVTLHDGIAVPKVIDFGIAKATEGRLSDFTVYTQLHQFIGTPAYMSPEQAEMSGLDIDTRSDIYSLGVLLYEMLTGQTPFPSERLLQLGLDEMRRIIREEEPMRPSTRLSTLGPAEATQLSQRRQIRIPMLVTTVKGDLDWIVMKAMEKDRTRRYATSVDFAADVQRHLNNEAVLAGAPSRLYRLKKAVNRNRLVVVTGTITVAALAIGLGISLRMVFKEKEARAAAVASAQSERKSREAETSHRKRAQEVSDYLISALRSPHPARDGFSITVVEVLDRNAKELQDKFSDDPYTKAKLLQTIGWAYAGLGLMEKSLPPFEKAVELFTLAVGKNSAETLAACQDLALHYWNAGKPAKALPLAEDLYQIRLATLGFEHPDTIMVQMAIGNYLFALGRRDEGLAKFESGFKLLKAKWGSEHVEMFWPTTGLADMYRVQGRTQEALALSEPLLKRRREKFGNENSDTLHSMRDVANDYIEIGRRPDALTLLRETVLVSKKWLGLEHQQTFVATTALIKLLVGLGGFSEAEDLCRETLGFTEKHPDRLVRDRTRPLRAQWYDILIAQHRWHDAELVAREAVDGNPATPGATRSRDEEENYDLAYALFRQKKLSEAEMMRQSQRTGLTQRNSLSGAEFVPTITARGEDMAWARDLVKAGIRYRVREEADGSWRVAMGSTNFSDCSVFKGANITSLDLYKTGVSDLGPLHGMPLRWLNLMHTPVHDLAPLQGCPLTQLLVLGTSVTNLSPLRGMPIELLQCSKHTTDLSPLRGLPLRELQIGTCTRITDYSPLADIKALERLLLPTNATGIDFLRQFPRLERLSFKWDMTVHRPTQTAEEFWAEYDQPEESK